MKKISHINNWISWFFGLGIIPFFIARFFLMKWDYATCWWMTALFMIIPIDFLAWKVIYLSIYLKEFNPEKKEKLAVWLLSGSTALLIAGAYFAIIGFFGLLDPYAYLVPLTMFAIMKAVGLIYDFLVNVEIFTGINHDAFLGIALFFVYIVFAVNSSSYIMIYLAKILAIVLSVFLTVLVLKSCLLDKISFKNHKVVAKFISVALFAVAISVYAIYLWFWEKDVVEQVLFSAIAGIYAAVLGGAITLGGVAWTIRKADEDRKEEERKRAKPIFTFVKYKGTIEMLKEEKFCHRLQANQVSMTFFEGFEYGRYIDEIDNEDPDIVLFVIENSEHAVFTIEEIYHDKKWRKLFGNKVVLPSTKVYVGFNLLENDCLFKNDCNVFIKIKDSIGNLYYYKITVCSNGYISTDKNRLAEYTISDLQEITQEEINESINKLGG